MTGPNLTYTTVVVMSWSSTALMRHPIRHYINTNSVRRGQALNWDAALSTLDDVMNAKATLNEFFAIVGQPQRSEAAANTLLNVSEDGYVTASSGRSVNIRPLFTDEALYIFVEIRRQKIVLSTPDLETRKSG